MADRLQDSDTGAQQVRHARLLVNAGGPWVGDIIAGDQRLNIDQRVRLVRGSHIVTKTAVRPRQVLFLSGHDGRIIFAIPYETDFTLIGTTDAEHDDPTREPDAPKPSTTICWPLRRYFKRPVTADDIVWTYSGVRPLYDDGATSATAATRDYVLKLNLTAGAPVLNVFGGKITTYRRLAEAPWRKSARPCRSRAQTGRRACRCRAAISR